MEKKSIQSIRLEGMTFAYEGAEPLFSDITIELPKAKAVWIRSPGGRGRSTFLRILAGLAAPQKGSVFFNSEKVTEMSFEEFLPYRLNIGFGFDLGGLLNNKTIFENLYLPLQYHNLISAEEASERLDEMIRFFGIAHSRDLRPFAVSGSVRKLTCVLRAFVHQPQIVILDEPLTGLKEDHVVDLLHFIEEGFAGRGLRQILFTGDNPALANRFQAEELLISENWFTVRAA